MSSQGKYSLTLRDYDAETAKSEFNIGTITAVNLASRLTDAAAFRSAVDGVTLGVLAADTFAVSSGPLSGAKPTDKQAEIERKWRVFYFDNTQFLDAPVNAIPNPGYQKSFHNDIPTPDSSLKYTDSDRLDITTLLTPGIAFKSAFETFVRSPYGGTVTVKYVQLS